MNIHQITMNQAYAIWEKNKAWSKGEFLMHLSWKQKTAVVLGNLNYQVENGGFEQWIFNGYADAHMDVIKMIAREIAEDKKYKELEEALDLAIDAKIIEDEYSGGFRDEDDYDDYEDNQKRKALDKLDDRYYELKRVQSQMNKYVMAQD